MLCSTAALDAWADSATSRQLEGLEAAWSGEQVLVVGSPLPPITEGTRFWGQAVLVPLGWRPEPAVSEPGLRAALGLDPDEIALVTEAGVQVIPRSALGPVRRSGVRVLARGPRP